MAELQKTKSGWRWARRILIALAVVATLIALFYTEENWRGKHDWDAYRSQWEAKGERFDWRAFVPPTVPDDQNFYTAPVFTNILDRHLFMTTTRSDGGFGWTNLAIGYWAAGRTTDLDGWQSYYRHPKGTNSMDIFPIAPHPQTPAADVALALSKYDSTIEALQQAGQRSGSYIPLNYEDGFDSASALLPYLEKLKQCGLVLQLRAVAELDNGQNEKACDDVMLMFRLNDSLRGQPFLITHLVHIAIFSITLQPVWEGLVKHQWTDAELARINAELGKLDFLADYEFTMCAERAFAIKTFEQQRITRRFETWDSLRGTNVIHNYRLMPAAYFYQNELNFARVSQQWILPLVDTNARIASPAKWEQADDAVKKQLGHFSPYKMQARMTFPVVGASFTRFAFSQAGVDLARTACALERYHLAHGEYPQTLDALTPQFIEAIPHDVINGQPLHYRRTDDGKFLLYSVGWNEKDDGGQIVFNSKGNVDRNNGDWVWPAAAN
jgi:hypothetical protein